MLVNSQTFFKHLLSESKKRPELKGYTADFLSTGIISTEALKELYGSDDVSTKLIDYYMFLIKKLHKIVNELLSDEPKTVTQCIKTITSLITQATITLEKQFNADELEDANEFIECIGLKELSNALYIYFSTGDISEMENQLKRVKDDILLVKDLINKNKAV